MSHKPTRWGVAIERLDRSPALLPLLVVLTAFAFNVLFGIAYEIPVPRVHDEFAYLLTGDTFAHGRLANPTHPMHAHFESFHVFHKPTYQAKYPPGQGFFLAIGQIITGKPIVGVWLSVALASGALYWMARARFSAGLALVASFLPVIGFFLNQHWAHSYWGGSVALLGGSLLFGGILRAPGRNVSIAVIAAVGLFILSITRPMEGLLTAALLLGFTLLRDIKRGMDRSFFAFWSVIVVGGLIAILFTLYYNLRLTGDALLFPHHHWNSLLEQPDAPALIKEYTGSKLRSPLTELLRLGTYFLGPLVLLISLLAIRPRITFEFTAGVSALIIVIVTALSVVKTAAHPHYLAPLLPLVYYLVLLAVHALLHRGKTGRIVAISVVGIYFAANLTATAVKMVKRPGWDWHKERAGILQDLAKAGKHLVLVRYADGHDPHREYVYNAADIDGAPVVWARDLGHEKNRALLDYFRDRTIWLLEADKRPNQVEPYPRPSAQ